MRYKIQYIDKKYPKESTLALELGSLCHAVLEEKGKMLSEGKVCDYDRLAEILHHGIQEADKPNKILGLTQLKHKYFEDWYMPDSASGVSYEDKIQTFYKVLHEEMDSGDWVPTYFEKEFEFVWDNKAIIRGFIDRIDMKNNCFKTVDYKTSKKVFRQSDLSTSLQFGIYALAILNEFGALPVESEYRFILIDDKQFALTKGWEKRLIKTLDKLFENIEDKEKRNIFEPKPSPLCYWCGYCENNPNATIYKGECSYFSKWTPTQKTFEVNQQWDESTNKNMNVKRKLIF